MLSVRKKEGRPSGFEPEPRGSRPRMLPLHHDHHAPMPASPASADHRRVDTEIERREIIMGREAGRIFRRRAGTTGLEPARARLTSECS
jgi:hypothetical protein